MDKFVQQLLGRYSECKLTFQTGVDHSLIASLKPNHPYETIVKNNLAQVIANHLINKTNVCTIEKMPSPFTGQCCDMYRATMYGFSKQSLCKLIEDCYNAGMEAAKQ